MPIIKKSMWKNFHACQTNSTFEAVSQSCFSKKSLAADLKGNNVSSKTTVVASGIFHETFSIN